MTDIVERLLEQSKCVSRSELSPAITGLCSEAAYEIERLRAALREIADVGSPSQPDAALIRLRNVAREALGDN